ncbi:MAG: multidrug effflux MFS transporter, partial [Lactococcus lactis]
MIVAWISSKSLKRENAILTIRKGVFISFISTFFLMVTMFIPLSHTNKLIAYILGVFFLLVGIGISLPNCLSLALVNFSKTAGTSGAILSLGY